MPNVDKDWAKAQLKKARVSQLTGDSALALLEVWNTLDFPDEVASDKAFDVFKKLAYNQALVEAKDEVWVPAQAGFMLQVGDEVRVRADAYQNEVGRMHNGRRGKVVGIRSGDVIIRTTDDQLPFIDGAHHSFTALEKRIQ